MTTGTNNMGTQTHFLEITYEYSHVQAARTLASAAGSPEPAGDELDDLVRQTRSRQRVHVKNVATHLASLQEQGFLIVDVQPAVPPLV